jgi:putative spermidine/putrescine transport system ATP-binding protein
MARLVLEHVSKRYGESLVVADLSLDIPQGEFLVLLGPSGCGKTTTLRMIAGFVEPTSGSISLGGREVTSLPPWKRNAGLVFQSYALFPHLTVDENVAFGLEMRKISAAETRAQVAEALRLVRLEGFGERLPRQLSGGQQQRVALARALAFRPDVLLLDEPLSNLDAKLRGEVRVEIRELQQKLGLTTVMVTHDQDEALSMADRLVVMAQGAVQQVGTQRDLYERPAGRFVASFVGRSNFLEGVIAADGKGQGLGAFTSAGGLRIACASRSPGKATLAIRPEAVSVGAEAAHLDNSFEGVVEYISYLGSVLDVRVKLTPQDRIIVQIANRLGQPLPAVGETLTLGWSASVGQVFSEDA